MRKNDYEIRVGLVESALEALWRQEFDGIRNQFMTNTEQALSQGLNFRNRPDRVVYSPDDITPPLDWKMLKIGIQSIENN